MANENEYQSLRDRIAALREAVTNRFAGDLVGNPALADALKELFHAGAVRLSGGQGAFLLYQFDRRDVLRYTLNDRLAAYRRAFGYGSIPVPPGTTPNTDFHH